MKRGIRISFSRLGRWCRIKILLHSVRQRSSACSPEQHLDPRWPQLICSLIRISGTPGTALRLPAKIASAWMLLLLSLQPLVLLFHFGSVWFRLSFCTFVSGVFLLHCFHSSSSYPSSFTSCLLPPGSFPLVSSGFSCSDLCPYLMFYFEGLTSSQLCSVFIYSWRHL